MAENKKSFVAYCDWGNVFDELSNEEAGLLVKHLFDYVRDKNPIPKDKLTKMMFIQIQQSLKRDLIKYEDRADRSRENGKLGGRPKKPKKPTGLNENPTEPKKPDSANVTVSDNVIDNDIKESSKQVYHEYVYTCYDYCLKYFDKHLHPKSDKQKNIWLDTIDKLRRIDKIPYKKIVEIVKKTRENDFWSKNFLSLTKLRKKNKEGILYAIVFNEQIKSNEKTNKQNGGVSDEYIQQVRRDMES